MISDPHGFGPLVPLLLSRPEVVEHLVQRSKMAAEERWERHRQKDRQFWVSLLGVVSLVSISIGFAIGMILH